MHDATRPTLDQMRAQHAWESVTRMTKHSRDDQKAYRREAKRLPVRTVTAGLGHALAFLNAKRTAANCELLRDVADWVLKKCGRPESVLERPKANELIEKIIKSDSIFLQTTTDEVLAYTNWLNRFAEAELEDEED